MGELGNGKSVVRGPVEVVSDLNGTRVKAVAAGKSFSVAVTGLCPHFMKLFTSF